jgi:hypothetical protein
MFEKCTAKEVKEVKLWGVDFSAEGTVYRKAYTELHKLLLVHMRYAPTCATQYLDNPQRSSLKKVNLQELTQLQTTHKYSVKDLNLLMKLELLREVVGGSLAGQAEVEETLTAIKCGLMPMCERRNFLEKSCWKLMRSVCEAAVGSTKGIVGHPL